MKTTIIGAGYVGLTTAVSLAYLGHEVTAVDKDSQKLALLQKGTAPIREPWLEELLSSVASKLAFTDQTTSAVSDAEVIMIAVGTPPKQNGEADTQYVEEAAKEIAYGLKPDRVYTLVVKSTVPIGTNRRVAHVVRRVLRDRGVVTKVQFTSNPEFLREGMAIHDTLYPDRIVVGAEDQEASEAMQQLYRPILDQSFAPPAGLPRPAGYDTPKLMLTAPVNAEMIKYSANAFLALKISFINEIGGLCEKVGADVTEVAHGIGLDSRIGPKFLAAGLGWGGSCFPKDTAALLAVSSEFDYPMPIVQASKDVNERQRRLVVEKLQVELKALRGRTVGVLGLAFKPNTDDVRESPGIDLVHLLLERGAHVRVHDPVAMANARPLLAGIDVQFAADPYEAATDADALVLATEWEEYRRIDWSRMAGEMRTTILVDGRNMYTPNYIRGQGLVYVGVGR